MLKLQTQNEWMKFDARTVCRMEEKAMLHLPTEWGVLELVLLSIKE